MEKLGRGLVAFRTGSSTVYIGWRLLATDPPDTGFNLYRSTAGGPLVKLNALLLTNTTDFVDTTANLNLSNAWFVQPVLGGVTQAMSAPVTLPASAPVRQYVSIPLASVIGGAYPPYDVKFCWVGDLDGDGEYDFVVDRLSTTANTPQYLQGYKRNGILLFQVDLGFNSTNQYHIEPGASAISTGHGDKVTVYDLDGDGFAEVLVCTANGVVFRNSTGTVIGSVTAQNNNQQFLSVLDGRTGTEKARATVPNPWLNDGPLNGWFFIAYLDGVQPSIVFYGMNRRDDGAFQQIATAWDYRNGALTQRWSTTYTASGWGSDFHQVRIADLDGDGKDEISLGGFALDDDGHVLFNTELVHGDRHHTTDIDPDLPGLETFAIQQNNPSLLGMALYDAATGKMIKKWYASGNIDVGRGVTLDIDPRYRGLEIYAVGMGGIYTCRGDRIHTSVPWPNEGLWWDADLLREHIRGVSDYNPVIEKYNLDGGYTRLYSVYLEGVRTQYGGRAAFWGDILGDWREELVLITTNYSELRIYSTTIPATNRLYCLMQNPAYRCQATAKGYYQASYPDFYLGHEMPPPPPPPVSAALLVWCGGLGSNVWDFTTPNWRTNWFWSTNTAAPATYSDGATVLFDLTGSNNTPIILSDALAPAALTVHSPKRFEFAGPGKLTGPMYLTKAGTGTLVINSTNDYTGPTLVAEGLLCVNGRLDATHVTVRGGPWLNGRVGGTGYVAAVTAEYGGGVSPGHGTNSPGTLSIIGDLILRNGAISEFDISADPLGISKPNDKVSVNGNLILQGTNYLLINQLDTNLSCESVYTLITYSGNLVGDFNKLVVRGLAGVPVYITNLPGQIGLVVKTHRAPATVHWTGGRGSNAWDLVTTSNWLNNGAIDIFAPFDSVRFDAIGTTNPTVNLVGTLNPTSILVDSVANYTFAGNGSIIGPCTLTKSNTGTLTINARNNIFTGRTLIAGGTLTVPELGPVGVPSPLGNPPGGSTNLLLTGGATLRVTADSYTDRGMTILSSTNTLDIPAGQLTVAGQIVGPGTLQKLGAGTLALTASNSYTGGTIIKAGTVALGSQANQYGLGTGLVTLDGGALAMFRDSSTYDQIYWNIHVPTNSIGTLYADDRCDMRGALTGGGTLNFYVYYVRTTLYGDWSRFYGQINVYADSDGADFRVNNSYGYPNATVHLTDGVYAYHVTSGTSVAIGALSGTAGAVLTGAAWIVGAKNLDTTFAGSIYGTSITKVGTGTLTLTGNTNTYSGGTTVNGGTLQIGAGGPTGTIGSGNIINNATLVFNRSDTFSDTNFGIISGTGKLVKRGVGNLIFTKAHTYSGPTVVEFGSLVLTNAGAIPNSARIEISAGAILDVSGRVGGAMQLSGGKTILGNGYVNGNFTLGTGAVLAPGQDGIGTLSFGNMLVLEPGCTNLFELAKASLTNDHVHVSGTLVCGGTIVVTNLAGTISAGDTFKLFSAATFSGSFTDVILPALSSGLAWDTSALATTGIIKAVAVTPPIITSVQLLGTNVVISGVGGVPAGSYTVLVSTNVNLPSINWTPIATNRFDGAGGFAFTNTLNINNPQEFYMLRIP